MSRILEMSKSYASKHAGVKSVFVADPEGIEALNDIDSFENQKLVLKPNRYPKTNLEAHQNLD